MQCKDIPTLPILVFVFVYGGIGCNWYEVNYDAQHIEEYPHWRSVREVMPDHLPDNLAHAKMRKLMNKGYIEGCSCGCRGDFELTEKGERELVKRLLGVIFPDSGSG